MAAKWQGITHLDMALLAEKEDLNQLLVDPSYVEHHVGMWK